MCVAIEQDFVATTPSGLLLKQAAFAAASGFRVVDSTRTAILRSTVKDLAVAAANHRRVMEFGAAALPSTELSIQVKYVTCFLVISRCP